MHTSELTLGSFVTEMQSNDSRAKMHQSGLYFALGSEVMGQPGDQLNGNIAAFNESSHF